MFQLMILGWQTGVGDAEPQALHIVHFHVLHALHLITLSSEAVASLM